MKDMVRGFKDLNFEAQMLFFFSGFELLGDGYVFIPPSSLNLIATKGKVICGYLSLIPRI